MSMPVPIDTLADSYLSDIEKTNRFLDRLRMVRGELAGIERVVDACFEDLNRLTNVHGLTTYCDVAAYRPS